jgi:hypothetical protein
MKVRVHFNLHTHLWSVVSLERGTDYGRVIAHESQLTLSDCTFKVSESTRQRTLKMKKRTVHAYVVGTWQRGAGKNLTAATVQSCGAQRVTYNPFRAGHFHIAGDVAAEVWSARKVWFIDQAAYFIP